MSNVAPIKIDITDGRLPIKDKGLVYTLYIPCIYLVYTLYIQNDALWYIPCIYVTNLDILCS